MSGMSSTLSNRTKCGVFEIIIFLAAIVFGTFCSICSKTMMSLHGIGIDGDIELFEKPIFQTFGMFVGMTFGLLMHIAVLIFKIPFPGYNHNTTTTISTINNNETRIKKMEAGNNIVPNETSTLIQKTAITNGSSVVANNTSAVQGPSGASVPLWMYFFLAIPSIFDIGATVLCMMGLRYLDTSIYQLLRGSGIIFVALMKQHVLGDALHRFQWIGVVWNVISVGLVGLTAILNTTGTDADSDPKEALFGVLLVMAGAFIQALQFVFEEKVMAMDDDSAPPLLLIGMEGLWGTVICLLVVYPLAYFLPGSDHGSFEDPYNTWAMIVNTPTIQYAFLIYFFTIFFYNLFAVLVTYALNSIWHAILDNFRPITVWCMNMIIFYIITQSSGEFGEPWTYYSFIQLIGMVVLLYGTAIYNAPNSGSVLLKGQWYAFYIDLSSEYEAIEEEEIQAKIDHEWELLRETFKQKRFSSLIGPHM
jgi:drug/metabolite transporter (DMT)-like permease